MMGSLTMNTVDTPREAHRDDNSELCGKVLTVLAARWTIEVKLSETTTQNNVERYRDRVFLRKYGKQRNTCIKQMKKMKRTLTEKHIEKT